MWGKVRWAVFVVCGPWLAAVVVLALVAVGGCSASRAIVDHDGGRSETDADSEMHDGGVAGDGGASETCLPETALPCECPGGRTGYRYCDGDRVWGACECPPLPPNGPGLDGGSSWPDGGGSWPDGGGIWHDGGGAWSDATVPGDASLGDGGSAWPEPPGGCTGDPEWCDGYDNDCDGRIDNGEPCPDGSIAHTEPYDGTVWARGSVAPDDQCRRAVMQLWPEPKPESFFDALVPCRSSRVQFGRDAQLHYWRSGDGIFRVPQTGVKESVDTPPCFAGVASDFTYDGMDRLYYRCGSTLRRGNGELLGDSFEGKIEVVLSSGRLVTREYEPRGYALRGADGSIVSHDPMSEWVGTSSPVAVVAAGNAAYATFARTYRGGTRHEAVILRVDGATGRWSKVRRVPVAEDGASWQGIGLPDGTVLSWRGTDGDVKDLVEHPPGAPARIIWRESDATVLYKPAALFAGP